MNSKALKKSFWDGTKRKNSKNKLIILYYAIRDFIEDKIIDPPYYAFYKYKERISRSWAFAKIGWLNFDFDFGTTYELLVFKLKRVKIALENGYSIQSKEEMDALKEAIVVSQRLSDDKHDSKYHKIHNAKWGNIRSKFIPQYDSEGKNTGSLWETSRKNVKTDQQKDKERKEFRICFEKGEADRLADHDRLHYLFKTYGNRWWD